MMLYRLARPARRTWEETNLQPSWMETRSRVRSPEAPLCTDWLCSTWRESVTRFVSTPDSLPITRPLIR